MPTATAPESTATTSPATCSWPAESPTFRSTARDTHWNIRGNRVAAEAEAAFLARSSAPLDPLRTRPEEGGKRRGSLHAEGRDLGTKLRKTGSRDLEIKPAEEDARGGL